jgi:two-component system OmpR family response regulator
MDDRDRFLHVFVVIGGPPIARTETLHMTPRILVIEPDEQLRGAVCLHLSLEGYECDGHPGLERVASHSFNEGYSLAVIDLKCMGSRSHRNLGAVFGSTVPKLVVARQGGNADALTALEGWADDFVTMPFEMRELVARAHALLRRKYMQDADAAIAGRDDPATIVYDGFVLDAARRRVKVEGHTLTLTESEFQLLHTIAKRPGVVFPRAVLSSALDAELRLSERRIDGMIMGIRRELNAVPVGWEIVTIRGVGYTFGPVGK